MSRRAGTVLSLVVTATSCGLLAAPSALAADPVPVPYGGQLDAPDPGDQFSSEETLEFAMLALGTVNGLAFTAAMASRRLRGPSTAMTRRALIERTAPGRVTGNGWSLRGTVSRPTAPGR